MTQGNYSWTDNPTVAGESVCNTDVLNECLMHLKYENGAGKDGFHLFDTKITDRTLSGDEAVGWALQGSIVTMVYPDAVNKIKELYSQGYETTYRGITCKKSIDGRYIADISQYTEIDKLFVETGVSDFYILDEINEQFHLPKTKWFYQFTNDQEQLNSYNEAGLPNITGNLNKGNNRLANGNAQNGSLTGEGAFTAQRRQQYNGYGSQGGWSYATDVSFDASLSNPIYGASDSVQPPSSNKLLYYKVGDTVINSDQALIDAKELLADGYNAVENKINEGLESISNASQALRQTQITNCILESPNGVADFEENLITIKQGLKVLIPNGRNADGTLNNIEYVVPNDIQLTRTIEDSDKIFIVLNQTDNSSFDAKEYNTYKSKPSEFNSSSINYVIDENKIYQTTAANETNEANLIVLGYALLTEKGLDSQISEIKTYKPFKSLDYNDTCYITHQAMPSEKYIDLTLGASGSTYIAPADGWLYFKGTSSAFGQYINLSVNYLSSLITASGNNQDLDIFIPCPKGDLARCYYNVGGNKILRFIYAKGAE